jgi:hypothetical protein
MTEEGQAGEEEDGVLDGEVLGTAVEDAAGDFEVGAFVGEPAGVGGDVWPAELGGEEVDEGEGESSGPVVFFYFHGGIVAWWAGEG